MISLHNRLNTFCHNYFENPSKIEIASYFSIVGPLIMGALLGLTELVSCCFQAKIPNRYDEFNSKISDVAFRNFNIKKMSQREMTAFFRSITTENIPDKLVISGPKNGHLSHTPCYLRIGSITYLNTPPSEGRLGGCMSNYLSFEDDHDKFIVPINGTMDKIEFDNFDQVLKFWMKGDFYQGDIMRTPYYLIELTDGTVLKYNNPFYK